METIYILWLRQVKKYLRSRSRIVGSLAQPILFLLAFGFGFGSIYQKAGGGNYIQYLVPGIIAMSILFTSIFTGIEIIWDRQFGFLKETMVAPVSRFEIMLGFQLIMNCLVMPIFFLSGALFPLQGLPKFMEVATKIDPLTYG